MLKLHWPMETPLTPSNKTTFVPEQQKPIGLAQPSRGFVPHADAVFVAPVPRLVIYSPYMQRSLALGHQQEWVIGRNKDSTIVLPDRWSSRHHAVVKADERGQFNLIDLESLNGTFVNSQKISKPYLLKHRDIITIGETEIQFIYPNQGPVLNSSVQGSRFVLMTHASRVQGEMWREILNSQGISTIWGSSHFELEKVIGQVTGLGIDTNLLMLDLGMPKTNPYDFCRQYHASHPDLRIILLNGMRTEVHEAERKWAKNQGALNLFAALPREHLFAEVTEIASRLQVISQALDWPMINGETLTATLMHLQSETDDIASGFF